MSYFLPFNKVIFLNENPTHSLWMFVTATVLATYAHCKDNLLLLVAPYFQTLLQNQITFWMKSYSFVVLLGKLFVVYWECMYSWMIMVSLRCTKVVRRGRYLIFLMAINSLRLNFYGNDCIFYLTSFSQHILIITSLSVLEDNLRTVCILRKHGLNTER